MFPILSIAVPRQGMVGVYNAAVGTVADGHNTSAFDIGSWGITALENSVSQDGVAFSDSIALLCDQKDVNQLFGMLIAGSEGGAFSNLNDTALLAPLPLCRSDMSECPRGRAGMLQGAARFSELARTRCPQITGVIIDDFWTNLNPNAPPAPPPSNSSCAACPANASHVYGSFFGGFFCCPWLPTGGHCVKPPDVSPLRPRSRLECCLFPGFGSGTYSGCQGLPRCGTNPTNATPCGQTRPLSPADMADLKAALQGKPLLPGGGVSGTAAVNHSAPALTPQLQLLAVTYEGQISLLANQSLIERQILDGVSFWISGPHQNARYANLTRYVAKCRELLGPTRPVLTGGYLTHSHTGWLPPAPFYDLLRQSIAMYAAGAAQGFFLFAGTSLHAMNASLWAQWALPSRLQRAYFSLLGGAAVTVVDAATGEPLAGALVNVTFGAATHVTSKRTRHDGTVGFGGWAGASASLVPAPPHTVRVSAAGFEAQTVGVTLQADTTVRARVAMRPTTTPSSLPTSPFSSSPPPPPANGTRAFYVLFSEQVDAPTWPAKVCQNNGRGPQGGECVDARSYTNGVFVASPQNFTAAHVARVKASVPGSSVLAYFDFGDAPLAQSAECPFCRSHIMGDRPGRNCSTTYTCGPSAFLRALQSTFAPELAVHDITGGAPGVMVESYPGLAKYVWSKRLASLLATFLSDWLLEHGFDGLYLDGYVEPDRVDFHRCALHAEGCQSFIKPGRTYDVDGDGKPDSAAQVYGQYFAWAPAFVAMVRARLGAGAVMLANSAGSISDTSLSGVTIEMEACVGALGGPAKCADALEAQRAASLAAGHQPLSVLWLTHSDSVPPQKQCEEVAALQQTYPWVQAGTDFFDGSHIVC